MKTRFGYDSTVFLGLNVRGGATGKHILKALWIFCCGTQKENSKSSHIGDPPKKSFESLDCFKKKRKEWELFWLLKAQIFEQSWTIATGSCSNINMVPDARQSSSFMQKKLGRKRTDATNLSFQKSKDLASSYFLRWLTVFTFWHRIQLQYAFKTRSEVVVFRGKGYWRRRSYGF